MEYYVLVYVGCEGLEGIHAITTDKNEMMKKYREVIKVLKEEDRYFKIEHLCIMKDNNDKRFGYQCCCEEFYELGLPKLEESIYY